MKIVALVIVFSSLNCWAFTLVSSNSNQSGWASKTVTFKLNSSACPPGIGDILNAATGLWNSVATSGLTVKVEGISNTTPTQLKNQLALDAPVIVCDPVFGTTTGQDPNNVPAVGFIGFQTQPISYGGIILNVQGGARDNLGNISTTLAQITIAHEMGHALGLGHSADSSALMYWDATSKTHLALAQDDIDGISYLYPRNEFGSNGIMGCGSLVDISRLPRTRWAGCLFLLFPLVILVSLKARVKAKEKERGKETEKETARAPVWAMPH